MNFGRDIEYGGYPTSETRTISQMRRDADAYAGIGIRGRKAIQQHRAENERQQRASLDEGPSPAAGPSPAQGVAPATNAIVQRAEADRLGAAIQAAVLETKKDVDTPNTIVIGSLNAPITAPPIRSSNAMTLTFKSLSRNGKNAFYTGAANVLRFPIAAFVNKTYPTTIEIVGEGGDLASAKAPRAARVKMTEAEKEAAKLARKNAPKPTEAERIAKAEAALAKRKAKLAAEAPQPEL